MKKISVVLVAFAIAAGILSCSHSENIAPTGKSSLGLVIPNVANGSSDNLLLLKDGRTANPISGIPNFRSIVQGTKLAVSFVEGKVHNGITDINVTKFSSATDSVFVPSQPAKDTISVDSLAGTYTGLVYKLIPSADPRDSTVTHSTSSISISFTSDKNYSCTGLSDGYPGSGSGKFAISHGTFAWYGTITFKDSSTQSNSVLNGPFTYYSNNHSNTLALYATINGISYSLYLQRR